MARTVSTVALALILAATGCEPAPTGEVRVLVADLTEDGYRPVVRTITTLGEPGVAAALQGSVARIRSVAQIALAVPIDTPSTLPAYRSAMILDPGEAVRPRWTTVDGALYPRDFDGFALTTLYHHIEQAALYYDSLGAEQPGPLDVYYLGALRLEGLGADLELTDNALYFFGVRFLVATRFEVLQDVPLGMNRGVVVHEMGHAMFDTLVYDDDARLRLLDGEIEDRTANLLRSITEGLSDFFAAVQTGDPRFLDASVPPELMSFPRNVDEPIEYTTGILGTADAVPGVYDPYLAGTCLASALWRMDIDRAVLGAALVEAQRELGARLRAAPPWDVTPEDFGLAWLLDPLVVSLGEADRVTACAVIVEQLPAAADYMSECP